MNGTLTDARLQAAKDLDAAADLIERVGHWRSGVPATANRNRDLLEQSTCAGLAIVETIDQDIAPKRCPAGDPRAQVAFRALLMHLGLEGDSNLPWYDVVAWNDDNDEATVLKAMRDTAGELRLTAAIEDPSRAWLD